MNPCLNCGACCAWCRVDLHASEVDDMGGQVPAALTETLTPTLVRMRGTDHTPPRCAALSGKVGSEVRCGIHPWRPSPCRELEAGSDACQRARAHHRLPALS